MKRNLWVSAIALVGAVTGASAQTLAEAFEAALRNDPTFIAAQAELDAIRQNLPIALAARLPSASATFSDAKVEGSREVPGFLGPVRSGLDYRSPSYAVNIRVPLVNPEAQQRQRQVRAQVEQAESVFAVRRLELMDRTAVALLNLRKSELLVELAAEPVRAATALVGQSRNRLASGEATRMELADAEAALAQSAALQASAIDAMRLARMSLMQLLGGSIQTQSAWKGRFPEEQPPSWPGTDEPVELLVSRAKVSHPAIAARRLAVLAASAGIRRSEAGHLPKADLVLSASKSRNESLSTLNQAVSQSVISAQLSVPLYSGGGVMASTVQAVAALRRAEAELTAEEQTIEREVTRLHASLHDQSRRFGAQRLAVEAAKLSAQALQFALGEKLATASDVAQARKRVAQERQTLAEIEHEGTLAWLRLQLLQGEVPEGVALSFDEWWRNRR